MQEYRPKLAAEPQPGDGLSRDLSSANRVQSYIECRDLFKIYKPADLEVVALRGVDLEAQNGELMAIVGASGSGKTTLLNILAGLERPSAGQVRVGRRDLLNISDRELVLYRRSEVGFVWQATSRNLVPYLSVRDNVELPMAIAGVGAGERRSRSIELLSALKMEDKARRFPGQLSGGEQQRVAIGVALANRPPLLLADEPTGELDTQMAVEVFELLREMNRLYKVTVVIVTHYPGVAHYVDRVVHITDGRISSESFLHSTFQRSGATTEEEYLVVDRAGRLQLPKEYLEKLRLSGLAIADIDGDQITIKPAGGRSPYRRDSERQTRNG
jgi:putative ABC transport system ATP-binding protein